MPNGFELVCFPGQTGSDGRGLKTTRMTRSGNRRPRDQIHFALPRGSIVVRFSRNRLGIDLGVSMQRREFITLIGVAAVTQVMLPQLACAQVSTRRPLLAVLAGVTRREFPA